MGRKGGGMKTWKEERGRERGNVLTGENDSEFGGFYMLPVTIAKSATYIISRH